MPEKEKQMKEKYQCANFNGETNVEKEYFFVGEDKCLVGFVCDKVRECDVGKLGNGHSFDWDKCVHPEKSPSRQR